MSKNEQKLLSMSFLPIILILVLIFGAGYLLIEGEVKLPWMRNDNTLEVRRLEGFPTTVWTKEPLTKQRIVIKSQEELEQFLKNADPDGNLALGEKIDFDKEYLLGVSSETEETEGNDIKVKRVNIDKDSNTLKVIVRQNKPGDSCTYDVDPNAPVDLVAIGKTESNIEFETTKETLECN